MKDKEINKFFWIALFLVTGFSFFGFSKLYKYVNGSNLPVFTWIGLIALLIGSFMSIRTLMEKSE